jgi:hypothetical protein
MAGLEDKFAPPGLFTLVNGMQLLYGIVVIGLNLLEKRTFYGFTVLKNPVRPSKN